VIIYAEDIFDKARVALFNRLNNNLAALQLLDPPVNAIVNAHNTPSIAAPAVSIDLDEALQTFTGASDNSVQYNCTFSVRIHAAYVNGFYDRAREAQATNSILNYIRENPELTTGVTVREIPRIRFGQTFTETTTMGSEIFLTIELFVIDEV
jgi:hypothetical protein